MGECDAIKKQILFENRKRQIEQKAYHQQVTTRWRKKCNRSAFGVDLVADAEKSELVALSEDNRKAKKAKEKQQKDSLQRKLISELIAVPPDKYMAMRDHREAEHAKKVAKVKKHHETINKLYQTKAEDMQTLQQA